MKNKDNNLNKILLQKGWTKKDLAIKTDMDEQYIGKVANGQIEPTVRRALIIAKTLKMDLEKIWPLQENEIKNFMFFAGAVGLFLLFVIAKETKGIYWNADICYKGFDAWIEICENIYYIDFIIA